MPFAAILLAGLPVWAIILISVFGVILAAFIGIVIWGRQMQKKQEASQADIEAMAQTVSMLIIDKKRLRPADAQLPKMVLDQLPKYARLTKLPIVKAKIGPRIMTLIADPKVYDQLPVKTEAKVVVSGIYITELKYTRGKVEPVKPSKNPFKRLAQKAQKKQEELKKEEKALQDKDAKSKKNKK